MTLTKIVNKYGNFDALNNAIPKGYQLIRGQRLQLLANRHRMKFVPAVTTYHCSKYGNKAVLGGIVVTTKMAPKLLKLIAEREAKKNSPQSIARRERARERLAKQTEAREKEADELAERIGYQRGSRVESWLRRGEIDARDAELIAFKSSYRHEFTDYDQQYDKLDWEELKQEMGFDESREYMREAARDMSREEPIPGNWEDYLVKYRFRSAEAKAMASVLKDPKSCAPCWFKACEIGLRGEDLTDLTYDKIRGAKWTVRNEGY